MYSLHKSHNIPTLSNPIAIVIDWYIETNRQYTKSYVQSEKYRLQRLSSYFGSLPLRAITRDPDARERIQDFINLRLFQVSEKHHVIFQDVT